MKRPGNPALMRKINQKLIVGLLREGEMLSRTELSKKLRLSTPSVSRNLEPLINKGVILEVGVGDSAGGRKPIMLKLNEDYMYIISIDLSNDLARISIENLKGEILGNSLATNCTTGIRKELADDIIKCIYKMLEKNKIDKERIAVITVGIPGVIDTDTGEVIISSKRFEDEKQVDISDILKNEFNIKVEVHNDTNLAARGEYHYGEGRKHKNLVLINIDGGVGGGIVIDGEIYAGSNFAAGEIGYFLPSVEDIGEEHFSSKLRLENRISTTSLISTIKKELKNGEESILLKDGLDNINFNAFVNAALKKDEYCLKKVDDLAKYLSWISINIISLLDIGVIIVGGQIAKLGELIEIPVNKILRSYMPDSYEVEFKCSCLREEAVIKGAFISSLEYVFANITDFIEK